MLYLKRGSLCIIRTEAEQETVSKEDLKQPLLDRPCNVVYFETESGLYGLVSSGDLYRTSGDTVLINRSFTALQRNEFMKARQVFKDNARIREIPVINGRDLEGEFHRADDYLLLDRMPSLERNGYAPSYISSIKNLALVRPAPSRPYKKKYFDRMKEILDKYQADYTVIDIMDMVNDIDRFDQFLLVDHQEKSGALMRLFLENGRRVYYKSSTYVSLLERLESTAVMDYEEVIDSYRKQGVKVLLLTAKRRTTDYFKKTEEALRKRFPKEFPDNLNELAWPYAKTFFDDLADTPGYVEGILRGGFIVEKDDRFMHLQDMQSRYINVRHGERVTAGQPDRYERTIWFFGPCLVIGNYAGDEYTIESWLQKMLNHRGISARVVNCGCWGGNVAILGRISTTHFRKGDILVALMEDLNLSEEKFRTLDLWEILEKYQVPDEWMLDNAYHVNHHVNAIYAEAIFNKMLEDKLFTGKSAGTKPLLFDQDLIDRFYIKKYFYGTDLDRFDTAACCVINGNPFTNGHRAMIEQAARETDHVYVLVVREDASLFSFAERYAMAKEALKNLDNVTVVPSGVFMVNTRNFPAYYAKMNLGNVEEQAENHVRSFAAVASRLHVTHRYLGEEPADPITSWINEKSVEILPQFGMQAVIVPRTRFDGDYVSGSRVRSLAEKADPAVRNLVPDTTADLIFCTEINAIDE